jgi:hypothetical protein
MLVIYCLICSAVFTALSFLAFAISLFGDIGIAPGAFTMIIGLLFLVLHYVIRIFDELKNGKCSTDDD